MKTKFDPTLLAFLCDALQKPLPKKEHGLYASVLRHAAREGWVSFADIEDILCETDPRLYRIDLRSLSEAFQIPERAFFPRPRMKDTQVFGAQGFMAADAAALLIALRRFGFSVEAQPLVDLVMPQIKAQVSLTEAELSVFWYRQEKDRFAGLMVQADGPRPQSLDARKFTTETGYQIEIQIDQDGNPWTLTVLRPKRVRTKVA
ncbi:MAG: hypothetical protein K2X07_12185 [Caulobacteraceae bacterium]|nr:hypothetical protein [Caulobacteraceae bacterium]